VTAEATGKKPLVNHFYSSRKETNRWRDTMEVQREGIRARHENLRKMLLRKREEVEARIREELKEKMNEDLNSVFGAGLDLADLGNRDLGRDVDYELLTMYTETLKNIDEALGRVEEGSYSICDECGGKIREKRLKAIPFALYCLECQREKEGLKGTGYDKRRMERGTYI
jgi:DnaK suppressor protein